MRFSAATIFGLAASATAAVLPRSQLGSWDVSVLKTAAANGYNSQSVTAVYTSDETTEPITKKCSYAYNPTVEPKESNSCDEGFSATYDGTTVSLSQVVQEPSPNTTLFGNAPLTLVSSATGRSFSGEVTVEVTSATA